MTTYVVLREIVTPCRIAWSIESIWPFFCGSSSFPFSICFLAMATTATLQGHRGTSGYPVSSASPLYASPSLSFLFLVVPWLSANVERSWPHMHEALRYIHGKTIVALKLFCDGLSIWVSSHHFEEPKSATPQSDLLAYSTTKFERNTCMSKKTHVYRGKHVEYRLITSTDIEGWTS